MKKSDFTLLLGYLHRFFEGPIFSRQKITAFFRYVGTFCSLIYEKITGYDYSMVYYTKDESIHNSVYTKVPNKVLKRIFSDIKRIEDKCFIDVGCGKGYAVTKAAQQGFKYSGGVEYTTNLYNICCNNLKKKGIPTNHIYNMDAKEFNHYDDYDVFFFNNPFDETIMEPVAEKIFKSHIGKVCVLYFLNPHLKPRTDAIEKSGFKLKKTIIDNNEKYFTINVYSNEE